MNMQGNFTIGDCLQYAHASLGDFPSVQLDSELLLSHMLESDRSVLYSRPELPISPAIKNKFFAQVEKRRQHYPVAYLIGKREFWSMEFNVDEHTLIPRPETEHLVEKALELIPHDQSCRIADLGTGAGVIAIAVARERPRCQIIATDNCKQTLSIAKVNAQKLNVENISFEISDWFENITGKFDYILSNPPYIRENDPHLQTGDVQYEPRHALRAGQSGLDAIKTIIKNAPGYLNKNGWILIEHGFDQGTQVRDLFQINNFRAVATKKDYAGMERISFGSL